MSYKLVEFDIRKVPIRDTMVFYFDGSRVVLLGILCKIVNNTLYFYDLGDNTPSAYQIEEYARDNKLLMLHKYDTRQESLDDSIRISGDRRDSTALDYAEKQLANLPDSDRMKFYTVKFTPYLIDYHANVVDDTKYYDPEEDDTDEDDIDEDN